MSRHRSGEPAEPRIPDDAPACELCADMALPGEVVALVGPGLALVRLSHGEQREVALDLLDPAVPLAPGARLLVHQGFAIARLEEEPA